MSDKYPYRVKERKFSDNIGRRDSVHTDLGACSTVRGFFKGRALVFDLDADKL